MEGHSLSRHFEFNGVRLPDIDEKLSPEEIRTLYSHQYPDIATASIIGPETVGDKLVYRFTRAIGSKGWPMSRNPKRKEVTKQAVLTELESLRQGRHARYRTLVGRFARCRRLQSTAALFATAVEASTRTNNSTPVAAPPGWLPPVS
jgi:PRTRC genetic system protein C